MKTKIYKSFPKYKSIIKNANDDINSIFYDSDVIYKVTGQYLKVFRTYSHTVKFFDSIAINNYEYYINPKNLDLKFKKTLGRDGNFITEGERIDVKFKSKYHPSFLLVLED